MSSATGSNTGQRPPVPTAWRGVGAVTAATVAVLTATAGRYGYHRDEFYFRVAGNHLAWGYPDQPPLTPVLARLAVEMFGDSLVEFRLLAVLATGLVVWLTGLLAREFAASAGAQTLAAGAMACGAVLLRIGHQHSTAVFDLLAWTALTWLVVRALRQGGTRWLAVGVVAGIALLNKTQPAFLLAALLIGLLAVGPRAPFRDPWLWVAGVVAALLWTPFLVWQATRGWPLLEVSAGIAAGSSGTSEPRWAFVPFQLVLVSPLLVPVWAVGWWRLLRDPELARYRLFAVAYPVLLLAFLAAGAKPYYLAGIYPVLLAAGAAPTLAWMRRRATRLRAGLVAVAVALSAAISAVLMLPLVPADQLPDSPILAINYDAGETIGWPEFAATIAAAKRRVPPTERNRAIVLTHNYGQAGAVAYYRDSHGLPPSYSGHMGYWEWGPPPRDGVPVIVIGFQRAQLEAMFGRVTRVATVDNRIGLDNDEQGTPVWVCRNQRASWVQLWPQLRRYD